MKIEKLKKLVSKLPTKPGIYLFRANNSRNIYIGKAALLKKRVLNYTKTKDDRIQKMVEMAKSLKYITTDSDIEALILESQYIKKHRPMFNVVMRDDKQYGFVGFTNDRYPKIFITHQINEAPRGKPRGILSEILPKPSCCVASYFAEQRNTLLRSARGRASEGLFSLSPSSPQQVAGYSAKENKTRNSNIETRNKFKILKLVPSFSRDLKFKTNSDFGFRASNFQYIGPFTDIGALKSTLRYLRNIFPYCACKQLHNNYCLNYHIGKCLGFCCLKENPEQSRRIAENKSAYQKNINSIRDVLSGKKKSLIKKLKKEMISQAKNHNFQEAIELRNKSEKLQRVFKNAQIIKDNKYIDMSIYQYDKTIKLLQKNLKLEKLPRRIEAYDISNIQGQNATGSMIVFTNGKPDKTEYRKFKIRHISTPNVTTSQVVTLNNGDTGMLREVLSRRFKHPEWPMPDLIIVDGGKGQLSVTKKIISNVKFKIFNEFSITQLPKIIALTKNERHTGEKIYIAGRKNAIPLSKLPSEVKNLILHIDSEAHRFAINYYRKLHRKSLS